MIVRAKTREPRTGVSSIDPHEVLAQLSRPGLYPDQPSVVTHIETHISHVFLTKRFAYKLKKPVRFEFLDFSTLDSRRAACLQELQLNRRLAPGVYMDVVPLTRDEDETWRLGGDGATVDWLVKMRRLPAEAALDVLLREQRLTATAKDELAAQLSAFYADAPPVTVAAEDYRLAIERHATANRDELLEASHHFDVAQVQRIHAGQLRVLRLWPDLLRDRCRDGRIVEGHGDLRPEHIYFTPTPVIIDCIEFNREFRTLDVVDELAFLAMECEMLGDREIAQAVLRRYVDRTGDAPPPVLLDFYCVYRACVRAKVQSLRADQVEDESHQELLATARKYLDLAEYHVQLLGPPVVVLIRGLSGTGKSTLANAISNELGWDHLSTDAIRRDRFGPPTGSADFEQGRYRPENLKQVYAEMHQQAERQLRAGASVILDGTYLLRSQRAAAQDLARLHGAAFVEVCCECSEEVARERIHKRADEGGTLSEVRSDFHVLQRDRQESDAVGAEAVAVDTTHGITEPRQQVLDVLRTACFPNVKSMSSPTC